MPLSLMTIDEATVGGGGNERSMLGDVVGANNDERPLPETGWVTLIKDGIKLVSSRLRLEASARRDFQDQ